MIELIKSFSNASDKVYFAGNLLERNIVRQACKQIGDNLLVAHGGDH